MNTETSRLNADAACQRSVSLLRVKVFVVIGFESCQLNSTLNLGT